MNAAIVTQNWWQFAAAVAGIIVWRVVVTLFRQHRHDAADRRGLGMTRGEYRNQPPIDFCQLMGHDFGIDIPGVLNSADRAPFIAVLTEPLAQECSRCHVIQTDYPTGRRTMTSSASTTP